MSESAASRENPSVVDRDQLVAYLDDLLSASDGEDYCPNGLQVEGRKSIRRMVTGVSACHELFTKARSLKADAILVHHGIFWKGEPSQLTGFRYRRVRQLILGELNLLAYHLPLDRHQEFGNNALAAKEMGLDLLAPFAFHYGHPTGFCGRFLIPISPDELIARCETTFQKKPLVFRDGPDEITHVAMVSGAAQRDLYGAIEDGMDAFITGEVSEWVMNVARECRIHYISAGHYATERLGVRALGEHIEERFGVPVRFIDIPNPV